MQSRLCRIYRAKLRKTAINPDEMAFGTIATLLIKKRTFSEGLVLAAFSRWFGSLFIYRSIASQLGYRQMT
jgi:hypothetical protein